MARGQNTTLSGDEIAALEAGRHGDPFHRLGRRTEGKTTVIRVLVPEAERVEVFTPKGKAPLVELSRVGNNGLFEGQLAPSKAKSGYRLKAWQGEHSWIFDDPYRFGPQLDDFSLHILSEGSHERAYDCLGAHIRTVDGVKGTLFAVWAPSAQHVSVVGDFNHWNSVQHAMRSRGSSGIWELFIPGVGEGSAYKYRIIGAGGHQLPLKSDPFAFGMEYRPSTASVVRDLSGFEWSDNDWMKKRGSLQNRHAPMSVYEVHLGSWQRAGQGENPFLDYKTLADRLIPYVKELGFTHIELLPITEHPFDGSWGYQPVGVYAPTRRFGEPKDFKAFVNACHSADIGVILDWVPGHFPSDEHGLALYDGTHLFEHADPRKGFHPDWNTLIYNYGRREVENYLVSNAQFWIEEYHLDGLRVDAVASMLYLDYSRKDGEWVPNEHGGNENLEAIAFLKRMNERIYRLQDDIVTIAEESTAWPGVSAPTSAGGLGFGFKWNMGWMNDTLEYMSEDPVHRQYHHHKLTFGINYAFSENYLLPLSHDEVVHGKGSLIARMPGDHWQRFANLRAYFGFMWTHPGKKLLFMGGEFAQEHEWNADRSLDWHLLDNPAHRGIKRLVGDLNHMYRDNPALFKRDCTADGFEWIDGGATADNVVAFMRWGEPVEAPCLVVCNFSPTPRHGYRIGTPFGGEWEEVMNTDSAHYGGSDMGNYGGKPADDVPWHGKPYSVELTLPPLATVVFRQKR